MRIFTVLVFMAAAAARGQTARLGDLGPDSTVVTNAVAGGVVVESDPVALPVAEAALGFATNALPKTGGTVSGFIKAAAFTTLPDPDSGLSSLFAPHFITLGYNSALGPLGPGVLNIKQNRIEGVNSYGKFWKLYYPTNHPTATFATLDDIPDVSDLATKSEVDVISNLVETTRGTYVDIASNITYHVVVSNGHWLIREGN